MTCAKAGRSPAAVHRPSPSRACRGCAGGAHWVSRWHWSAWRSSSSWTSQCRATPIAAAYLAGPALNLAVVWFSVLAGAGMFAFGALSDGAEALYARQRESVGT